MVDVFWSIIIKGDILVANKSILDFLNCLLWMRCHSNDDDDDDDGDGDGDDDDDDEF